MVESPKPGSVASEPNTAPASAEPSLATDTASSLAHGSASATQETAHADASALVAVEQPEQAYERVGAAPPALPPPRTADHQLRWTLIFLVVVSVTTFSAWGTAKLACNYHPPQSQKFKQASVDKLIARPQDAALQFQHSLFTQDYERARSLAAPEAQGIVERREQACDPRCQGERTRRSDEAQSRSTLYRIRGSQAWVKVETFFDGKVEEETYGLQRVDRRWLVTGPELPPPPDPVPSTLPSVAPHGSAGPLASGTAEALGSAAPSASVSGAPTTALSAASASGVASTGAAISGSAAPAASTGAQP